MDSNQISQLRQVLRQGLSSDADVLERETFKEVFLRQTGTNCYVEHRRNGAIAFVVGLRDQGPWWNGFLQVIAEQAVQEGWTVPENHGKTHPPQDVAASSEHGVQHGRAA